MFIRNLVKLYIIICIATTILLLTFASFRHLIVVRPASNSKSIGDLVKKCGYMSCPKMDSTMLNVHLVAHTHNDLGWLVTIEQYYAGRPKYIKRTGVKHIIASVVNELLKDPRKRFIYVESAFFFMWWEKQTPKLQEQVKQLVNEGRLGFIGGGWSMNDEATTHYQSIIDQFAWGLRRLNDTFGECGRPRIGWQIDPFGHSREMASIMAQMGYDGLFFGRLDYQDKAERLRTKKAEMIWRASVNSGESAHLFAGALYNLYQAPKGFCWDIQCTDDEIIDDKQGNNVKEKIDEFFDFVNKQSRHYRTNNLLITMGGDFSYRNAEKHFKNMDKLIRYGNARQSNGSKINLLYSTPSCYLKALHDAGITWSTKDDDFFPYASEPHAFWTGYYTSRPTLKRYERVGNHFLQVCKQLTALIAHEDPKFTQQLTLMREAIGVLQHHDAITGTEKETVAYDYALRLSRAMHACSSNTRFVLNHLTNGNETKLSTGKLKFDFKTCDHLNISSCDISENNDNFILTLYNPLAHVTFEYIRIPVPYLNYRVRDSKASLIATQIVPIPDEIINLRYRHSKAKYELVFLASELPPLGYKSYYFTKSNEGHIIPPTPEALNNLNFTTIGNEYINLTFNSNGMLSALKTNGITHKLMQNFFYYESVFGFDETNDKRSSGAYIFRPKADKAHVISKNAQLKVYRSDLVEEVQQTFNKWISQVIRVYRREKFIEFEWLVGPIPTKDDNGKEIITHFQTDIQSKEIFYTDSNGREMIKRTRDHRDTWNITLVERTAGNYYPVTTKIALQDENLRLAVLTDRAQGGSSMQDGSLELMLHRRLLHDDGFGVDEALNEEAFGKGLIARGVHYLLMDDASKLKQSPTMQASERFTQLQKHLPAWKFFSAASAISYDEWRSKHKNIFSGISQTLPRNIHLLSFEPWHDNEILVRFEHILENDEDPEFSNTVKFNLEEIFSDLKIADLRETTLDGNVWLNDKQRLKFMPDAENVDQATYAQTQINNKTILKTQASNLLSCATTPNVELKKHNETKFIIRLAPMQIRSFVLFFKKPN